MPYYLCACICFSEACCGQLSCRLGFGWFYPRVPVCTLTCWFTSNGKEGETSRHCGASVGVDWLGKRHLAAHGICTLWLHIKVYARNRQEQRWCSGSALGLWSKRSRVPGLAVMISEIGYLLLEVAI